MNKEFNRRKLRNPIIILVLFLLVMLLLYNVGSYLPIAGKMIAKNKIHQYADMTYDVVEYGKIKYDPFEGVYGLQISHNGDSGETINKGIMYILKHNAIIDKYATDIKNKQLKEEVAKISKEFPESIDTHFRIWEAIDGRDLSKKEQTIFLEIYNTASNSEEDGEGLTAEIASKIFQALEDELLVTGIDIRYFGKQGEYLVEKIGKKPLNISYDWVLENIVKNDKASAQYEEWFTKTF